MDKKRIGQFVFVCAFLLALVIYGLTAPAGLPWNRSSHLALAYLGEIVRLPDMPYPVWGRYVRVFGGSVSLSVFLASLAAALLASLVNRHFGWRLAAAAALTWIFLPGVWNRAITGSHGLCLMALAVAAAWLANAVFLRVLRKARDVRKSRADTGKAHEAKRGKVNRIVGWIALGVAAVFALVSLLSHDYWLGEPAGVFARGVVEEANGRVIVMNGVCDDQIVRESGKKAGGEGQGLRRNHLTISLRNDDAYRTNLIAWTRAAYPGETNLWTAATVSPIAFVDAAVKSHPESFYLMGGKSTTLVGWTKRWADLKSCLGSGDPFVQVMRRQFAYEANQLANRLAEIRYTESGEDGRDLAWGLYKRAYGEVDPGNFSALVNMSEMIRRGYVVGRDEKRCVHEALEKFFRDAWNRQHMKEIARASGPVRSDPEVLARVSAEVKKRVAERIAAGEKVDIAPEILSLVEWNNEMIDALGRGETVKAGRIARAILSHPKWKSFVPANAVLGAISSAEGDYVTGEAFFRVATSSTNRIPAVTWNDYADTLMHLRKLDEAEKMARRAVAETEGTFWLAELTLAQILEAKLRAQGESEAVRNELRQLLAKLAKSVPKEGRQKIADLQRRAERK